MSIRTAVIIPFRLRPKADLRRAANLEVVQTWWYAHGYEPQIVDDGLDGDAQFNRHRAYNRAILKNSDADVFVFTEADMLIHPEQIETGLDVALRRPGLVVPFTQYRYLSDEETKKIRDSYADLPTEMLASWFALDAEDDYSVFNITPESVMDNGKSIGAVNIVSRETLYRTGGYTEATDGNWYDDNIIAEGWRHLTGNDTMHVEGPAVHLYHLPGWTGDHLTAEDRAATARNKDVLEHMRAAMKRGEDHVVRALMEVRA